MLRIRLFALLLAAGACACGAASPTRAEPIVLDAEVTLAPGGAALVRDKDVEVVFVGVTEDSRCPTDVQCVWAGEVKARLSVRRGAGDATAYEVREGEGAVQSGYKVTLVRVKPYPVSARKIAAEDYRATLKVTAER